MLVHVTSHTIINTKIQYSIDTVRISPKKNEIL